MQSTLQSPWAWLGQTGRRGAGGLLINTKTIKPA